MSHRPPLASLRDRLPAALGAAFDEQLSALSQASQSLDDAAACTWCGDVMRQAFTESYRLSSVEAEALVRLAQEMAPSRPSMSLRTALVERVALQRACLVIGLGEALLPFWSAAAHGALEGFRLSANELTGPGLVEAAASASRALDAYVPELTITPSTDISRIPIGPSPLFSPTE